MTAAFTTYSNGLLHRVAVFPALKQRGRGNANIWFFHSPKNDRRFTIIGDVPFMHLVILEGDVSVESYDPHPDSVNVDIDGKMSEVKFDAKIAFKDGRIEFWKFDRIEGHRSTSTLDSKTESSLKERVAISSGGHYRVRTDIDLRHKEILFDNWLTLCAGINRCRNQSLYREGNIFSDRLKLQRTVSFGSLFNTPGIDHAHMLAIVALSLQNGSVRTELENKLFGLDSVLTREM